MHPGHEDGASQCARVVYHTRKTILVSVIDKKIGRNTNYSVPGIFGVVFGVRLDSNTIQSQHLHGYLLITTDNIGITHEI
jgi:hypothetical protein